MLTYALLRMLASSSVCPPPALCTSRRFLRIVRCLCLCLRRQLCSESAMRALSPYSSTDTGPHTLTYIGGHKSAYADVMRALSPYSSTDTGPHTLTYIAVCVRVGNEGRTVCPYSSVTYARLLRNVCPCSSVSSKLICNVCPTHPYRLPYFLTPTGMSVVCSRMLTYAYVR